jgi:hypothetical protein
VSFKEDVETFLLARGHMCAEGDWTYSWLGWYSPQDDGHSVGCRWVSTDETEVKEFCFSEFQDTDSDNVHQTVLGLTHVNCQCRKIKDVTIGVKGGTMELLRGLLGIEREYK